MWEESLVESRGLKAGTKSWLTMPLAMLFHVVVVGGIIAGSYWFVEAVPAPPIPVTLLSAPPPPPPPPPAPKKAKAPPIKVEEPPQNAQNFQPTEIPEKLPPPDKNANTGGEGGVEGGVEGGMEGGVPGGVLGGVPGGVIGGVPGGMGEETPMRITAEVKQPVLVTKVEPPYPEIARKARIQGVVILEAVITKTGTVEEVKVLRSLHPILDQAAINAVKQWRYQPATLNGRPVKVYFTVTVKFTLR
jgi:periplasmic protein TonB